MISGARRISLPVCPARCFSVTRKVISRSTVISAQNGITRGLTNTRITFTRGTRHWVLSGTATRRKAACLRPGRSLLARCTSCPGIGYVFTVTWITCWDSSGIQTIISISKTRIYGVSIPIRYGVNNVFPVPCRQHFSCRISSGDSGHL